MVEFLSDLLEPHDTELTAPAVSFFMSAARRSGDT